MIKQKAKIINNKSIYFLFAIITGIFMIGGVNGAECNNDFSNIGTNCTVSNSLTLNGTYTISANDTDVNGIIILNATNVILDCNNTRIIGNWTSGSAINSRGFQINANNVTLNNCQVSGYRFNVLSNNNFTTINNLNSNFGDRGIQFTGW